MVNAGSEGDYTDKLYPWRRAAQRSVHLPGLAPICILYLRNSGYSCKPTWIGIHQ